VLERGEASPREKGIRNAPEAFGLRCKGVWSESMFGLRGAARGLFKLELCPYDTKYGGHIPTKLPFPNLGAKPESASMTPPMDV
jgi:hypothetical protein